MSTKTTYQTKQKTQVLSYLETIPGQHVTAAQVFKQLSADGCAIGATTVYRCLERLVEEGLVNKYLIDANSPACFEYIGVRAQEETCCFHCKCEKCGKLIHLHCEELEEIAGHLSSEHHFKMDPFRTVFYGICEDCNARETEDRKEADAPSWQI